MANTMTLAEKKTVFAEYVNRLEQCWKRYGYTKSDYFDLNRAFAEGKGIFIGTIATLTAIYDTNEVLEDLFTNMDGIWYEYENRCWKVGYKG